MTTVDTRKSSVASFWQSSSPDMNSFRPTVTINSNLAEEQSKSDMSPHVAMYVEAPEKPIDQTEYALELMSSTETNEVDLKKSLKFNQKPYNSGNSDRDTAYLHEGMRLSLHLDPIFDPEDSTMAVEIRDSVNHFWNVWAVRPEEELQYILRSDPVKVGNNTKLGASELKLSFIDIATGASTNFTQPVEILSRGMYIQY